MTEKTPTAEETIAQAEAEERQRMNDSLRVQQFLHDVGTELNRAREKFPSAFACGLATMEEAGELAQALLKHAAGKWPQRRIYEEAVQVAVMAMRCALEGDASLSGHQYTEPGE